MRKWILWIVVIFIIISMITKINGDNKSFHKKNINPSKYIDVSKYLLGVLDTTFGGIGYVVYNGVAGKNAWDYGNSIYVDKEGKIYVTGSSSRSGSNTDMIIWRYNSNGSLDTSFNGTGFVVHNNAAGGNGNDIGASIYIDKEGKIYVTGHSWDGSNYDMVIWRYNNNGSLDKAFGSGGIVVNDRGDGGDSIYVDKYGKIYVTGSRRNGSNEDMAIWRYNSDGSLDKTFGSGGMVVHNNAAGGNGDDVGYSIYVDNNGKIYVTGWSWNGNNRDMVIWRYDGYGSLDTTFGGIGYVVSNYAARNNLNNSGGSAADDIGASIYVDSIGKIYVTGYTWNRSSGDNTDMVIWRYNSNGSLDTSFNGTGIVDHHNAAGGDGWDRGNSIYVDKYGKIYVTGYSEKSNRNKDMVIWKYNSDGSLDTAFGGVGYVVHGNAAKGNLDDEGKSIYVDSTGRVYVTGYSWNDSNTDMVIWKYK
jgi:uncharacterized delta-60 repeat protein